MADMQMEFPRDRLRAQEGQKVDATPSMVVLATSNATIPFGALVVYDDTGVFLRKLPVAKASLAKPLGITLRQLHNMNQRTRLRLCAKAGFGLMRGRLSLLVMSSI
jgi:hypothetical protein